MQTPLAIQKCYGRIKFDQHSKAECHMSERPTIHSNYRQVVLSSTLDFSLVFTLDGLPELGSSFKEIFLEKNQILHSEFTELIAITE